MSAEVIVMAAMRMAVHVKAANFARSIKHACEVLCADLAQSNFEVGTSGRGAQVLRGIPRGKREREAAVPPGAVLVGRCGNRDTPHVKQNCLGKSRGRHRPVLRYVPHLG